MINKHLILASKSPRRYELLKPHFSSIEIITLNVEEKYFSKSPEKIVEELAKLKLGNLGEKYFDDIVIAGDTIVWFDEKVLGKPKNEEQACEMLKCLTNNYHQVYSGFAISYKGNIIIGHDVSEVKIKKLSSEDIQNYVKTYSPLDKAGAYAIQDGVVVENFIGDLNTIVGMPVQKILNTCEKLVK